MQADVLKTHTRSVNINRNGYLYVYVSNQSNLDVFFDNLQVVHSRGPLLEETHYYPFGLTMAGISSKAAGKLENRFKFNDGTELTSDLGLEWYETSFRSYDAQLGRFHQIDPIANMSDNWSPFTFVQNNPLLYNDPLGLDTVAVKGKTGETTTATNTDGTTGSYVITPEGAQGTGMSGTSEEVVVSASRKKENSNKKSEPSTVTIDGGNDKRKTPWMDFAFNELDRGVSENSKPNMHNQRIIDYHSTTGKWKNDEIPWCASFVNWNFVQSNIPSLNSGRAFDYINFGYRLNKPAYGAVAIMNYSHVGFVAGMNADGRIVILGGNQANALNLSPNYIGSVIQYRYPTGFLPNFKLPLYKLKGRSLTRNSSR